MKVETHGTTVVVMMKRSEARMLHKLLSGQKRISWQLDGLREDIEIACDFTGPEPDVSWILEQIYPGGCDEPVGDK